MKMFSILLFVLLFSTEIVSAQNNSLFTKIEFDSLAYYFHPLYKSDSIKVLEIKNADFLNVFFFNGECSFCLVKMMAAEHFFQTNSSEKVKNLFIAETNDTIILNFYRDKYKIETPVLWDKNRIIREKLITDEDNICFLIDKSGEIILSGDFSGDEKLKKQYLNWMKGY